jgi:hypothetical protein
VTRPPPAAALVLAASIAAAPLGDPPGAAAPRARGTSLPAGGYPPETAYSLALHMHGSMSEQSGSWEWHTAKAESLGVDVVWWTDHDWRLSNDRAMKRFDFESAFWDSPNYRWKEPDDGFWGEFRYFAIDPVSLSFLETAVVDTLAFQSGRSFRLEATADADPDFQAGYAHQTCSDFQNHYSLAKRVKLRFRVFPEALDAAEARFVVEVELSDHPGGTPTLRYVLGSMDGEGADAIPLAFVPSTWNEYVVDVTADAIARFCAGGVDTLRAEDNTLGVVRVGLECRNGSRAVVFFDEYRIEPDPVMAGNALMDRARAMAAYYETLRPAVANFVGSEVSQFRAQPHLNAYAPDLDLVDYAGHVWSDPLHYAVDQVHAQGGALSLNHLFGPQYYYENDPGETPEHRDARVAYMKTLYIGNRALGADVLEVGYRRRGGCDLVHHLALWDALNANMVFVTGNGVTDSHGRGPYQLDGWGPSELGLSMTNNFVTWMYAEEFSEAGFVRSMKSGRAFFGDPYRWQGALDLRTADGFRMGQVVVTDRDVHDLLVEVTDVPPDVEVRLRQAEMRDHPATAYLEPVWLRDEPLDGAVAGGVFADTVSIDTTVPSFVRVEVRDGAAREMVFGNPLHFVREVPVDGIAAERAAARLGPLRVMRAEGFRLTAASWDDDERILHLGGDEAPPGTGRVTIDPGALGEPHSVEGVVAWSVVGGLLELQGFAGAGSAVDVSWGATTVAAGRSAVPALALSPSRPNPFGRGAAFEYALPRGGWVRLEVLDTAGRRVRVLAAEFQRAGGHRAVWDGRDESGRDVAAGVYYVRLEHDGRTLVRKTTRLR